MDLRQASGTGAGSGPTLQIGPVLDSAGAEYTGLVIGDVTLTKNGTSAAMAANATLTHVANGFYSLVMIGNNVDTLGRLRLSCNKATYQFPPFEAMVLPTEAYDILYSNTNFGFIDASIASRTKPADTQARVTLVDTVTTNTDMRGTNNALLAANYTAPPSTDSIATAVWAAAERTLTSFGSLVSDITSAVITAYGTAYDTLLNAIGQAASDAETAANTAASASATAASNAADAETAATTAASAAGTAATNATTAATQAGLAKTAADTAATEAASAKTAAEAAQAVTDKLDTMLEESETPDVYTFVDEAFENQPAVSVTLDQEAIDDIAAGVVTGISAIPGFEVEVVSPTDESGTIEVRQGDSYLTVNSRNISVGLSGSLPLLEDACTLKVFFGGTVTTYTGTVTVNTSTSYTLKFDLTGTQTAAMPVGTFSYEVEVTYDGTSNKWTPSTGIFTVKPQLG